MIELAAVISILEAYGLVGLLAAALVVLAWAQVRTTRSMTKLTGNDLHHITESLQRIEASLSAIEKRGEDIWDKLKGD